MHFCRDGEAFSMSRSMALVATFDRNTLRFSAILAGVSWRGLAENGHVARLPENPANIGRDIHVMLAGHGGFATYGIPPLFVWGVREKAFHGVHD
jgi:hypothetical protein